MKIDFIRHSTYTFLLLLCCLLEIACQTYWLNLGNRYVLSVIYVICGLAISILPLFRTPDAPEARSGYFWLTLVFFVFLSAFALFRAGIAFSHTELDYRMADMLPVIQVMNERWLAGTAVYAPIPEIWSGLQPNYLPAMWMPYLPAVAAGIDLRWVNIVLLIGGLAAVLFIPFREKRRSGISLLGLLPPAALIGYIGLVYPGLITITEEPTVIAFYLMLGAALFTKRPVLLGVALALCVLSRYALVFWIPIYFVYCFFFISPRLAWQAALVSLFVVVMMLLVSQAWQNLEQYFNLQGKYLENLSNPDKNWSYAHTIEKNLGFAKFVPFPHLPMLHRTLLIGSIILPWLSLGLFHRFRSRLHAAFFPICSLKLCLVFFFNMIPIPYSYLFYTSTFLSVAIVYAYLNGNFHAIRTNQK